MSGLSQIITVISGVGYVLALIVSCSAGQLDDPATQIVKSLSPPTEKQTDETRSIPNWFAPARTQSFESSRDPECRYRAEEQCDNYHF